MENIEMEPVGFGMPQSAREMLAAMARQYKHDLSEFESLLWEAQIFSQYPDSVVMRALLEHMETPGQDAKFMPKYGMIKARLEPVRGFSEIEQAVRNGSPYVNPDITDPVLVDAIHQMGGWALVCAEMPDPRERPIDFDRYLKRFEATIASARNRVNVQGKNPAPLVAIGKSGDKSGKAANLALAGRQDNLAIASSSAISSPALPAPSFVSASKSAQSLPAPKNAQDLSVSSRYLLRAKP